MKLFIKRILMHPLFTSSFIYILTDGINKAIPFLLLPVLTFYLSPSDYGIVTNFSLLMAVFTVLIGISVDGAIEANYYRLSKYDLSTYVANAIYIILVFFFILFILVFLFQNIIFDLVKIPVTYQFGALVVVVAQVITYINLALWRLENKPLKFGSYQISQTILNIALSLFFIIILKLSWNGRIDGLLIATFLFGLFSLFVLKKRGYLRFSPNKEYIRDILFFGLPLVPHGLSVWIRSGIDRIYITSMINEATTGIYSTGFQFGILMSFISIGINNAFVPFLFKNLSIEDEIQLKNRKIKLVKYTYIMMIVLFLLCVVLTFLSLFMVDYLLSVKYRTARNLVFWAILSQVFQGMYLLFVNYIFYAKKTKILAAITISCAVLQTILSYIFIKHLGIMGAAYSTVIISFINFLVVAFYSNKVYPMPWFEFFRKNNKYN